MSLVIFTDGASFGNPGPMGIGVVIYRDGKKVSEMSEYIGNGTNNVAEYTAVMRALEYAKESGDKEVRVKSDSQLIVRQLNGDYKVKDEKLRALKRQVDGLCAGMSVSFEHIPREQNNEADALSKEAAETGKKAGKEAKRIGQQKLGVFL